MVLPGEYITESSEHYYTSIVGQQIKEELRAKHATGNRFYHTWDHIKFLFRLLEMVDESMECLPAVVLAIMFHDSVYDARRKDNELRSAMHMRKKCKGLDHYWIERADTLILATQDHKLPADEPENGDMAYFLDMDMAILGSPPDIYFDYVNKVRNEYSHLADADWAARRLGFLKDLLVRANTDQLFYTDWAKGLFSEAARRNIVAEIEALENPGEAAPSVPLEG